MLEGFKLKFGRTPGSSGEDMPAAPVTVFVGPNNSGKSQILQEMALLCDHGRKVIDFRLLDNLRFQALDPDQARRSIDNLTQRPNRGESVKFGNVIVGTRHGRVNVSYEELLHAVQNPLTQPENYCKWYVRTQMLSLDGKNRMALVDNQAVGDYQKDPQSSFHALFRDDKKRSEVRRIIYDAFGLYLLVDPTRSGFLNIRLSKTPSEDVRIERGLDDQAIEFHGQADPINEFSDGVKAFVGLVCEIVSGDPQLIFIDEPEAFLHPALAFLLGGEISRAASNQDKRVFISTHSASFLQGCVQSGRQVNIVRLTYRNSVATARLLPAAELLELMRHPLLRSAGLLSGLFYECVVITESDTDRAFYQEINERLLQFKKEWGIPNCLFINGQNKQTVRRLLAPLRKLGIAAAGIVDIDVFKEGGTVWASLLESANVPKPFHQPLGTIRGELKEKLNATGKDMKTHGGIAILSGSDREAAEDLLEKMADYGIFVVPGGELESWMKHLEAPKKGPIWLVDIFEKMGDDPANANYVKPTDGDVWEFIAGIRDWMLNPKRKGIPD